MEFKLTPEEHASATLFLLDHKNCGAISYIFTPTGIGNNIRVRCNGCCEEKDITDYKSW